MNSEGKVTLKWHGAAHYHLFHNDLRIVLDPLYTRLPGDKPHLSATKESLDKLDFLLLTHGHLDHSWDFPYLVAKHNPEVYAPEEFLIDIEEQKEHPGFSFDWSKWHGLEKFRGRTFNIDQIEVTPYQIGTEEIDFWFIRSMFIRPWLHGKPTASLAGLKWLRHHLFCNCYAFLFILPPEGKSMLYFANLTEKVDELIEIDRVSVLALPYCPANQKWLEQSAFLIDRFKPEVTLVHHFDNFLNPFTLSKYMNLENYRRAILEKCPDSKFYFSKFEEEVDFADIVSVRNKSKAS